MEMDLANAIIAKTRGVVLIVTLGYDAVESGLGVLPKTHTDGENAEAFFLKCKYAVFPYHNITKKDFWTLCNQLAKYEYPKTCRRLVVIFSGHGDNGEMCFTEQETVSINEMVNLFKPADAENPTLGHMARIFFIDACRGQNKALGYPCKSFTSTKTVEIEHPNDRNMIVAYATTEGYICADGIWLTILLKELENPHVNLLGALVNVNIRMDTKKINGEYYQVGEHKSTLAEQIYFIREAELDQPKIIMKETLKGAGKGGTTQVAGSVASGTAFQVAKEATKRITGQGVKTVATQATKVVAKQTVLQTAKVAVPVGLAIEGVCWGYEINSAHNKKKRGEISEQKFHDIIVEQTATTGGSAAGGIGGGVAGATVGAVVGSVVPVVGTVIGGAVGGFIGGVAGGLGGSLAGKGAGKAINYARH